MRAMVLDTPAPASQRPLALRELPEPEPGPGEISIDVSVCGVCRTDLHVVEGDLELPVLPIVPGHEVVGRVRALGAGVTGLTPGERVGVGWVNRFCGTCDFCVEGRENLCVAPRFTGYSRNGGYAEQVVVPADYAYPMPEALGADDAPLAPLLCAGIIGYRALERSGLVPGRRLALYGFGGSAHIALQIALAWGCEVYVVSRGAESRARAERMGAHWVGAPGEPPPHAVEHAVTFAPAGAVLPEALANLRRGGTLAVAGIYLDRIPELDYGRHLFQEKNLVSVTANTRTDGRQLMALASRIRPETSIEVYDLEDAGEALVKLKEDRLGAQAAVLRVR